MKFIFTNHVGKVENSSINLCEVQAVDVGDDEHQIAMEQGFYSHYTNNIIKWRQARLVRIDLSKFNKDDIPDFNFELHQPDNLARYQELYNIYMDQRGYYRHPGDDCFSEHDLVIDYMDKRDIIVGYSKLVIINKVVDLKLFCVEDNKLDITSQHTLNFELQLFKTKGFNYAYLGPSYQQSSIFKSTIPGFEWWTGDIWSTEVGQFHKRCLAD